MHSPPAALTSYNIFSPTTCVSGTSSTGKCSKVLQTSLLARLKIRLGCYHTAVIIIEVYPFVPETERMTEHFSSQVTRRPLRQRLNECAHSCMR